MKTYLGFFLNSWLVSLIFQPVLFTSFSSTSFSILIPSSLCQNRCLCLWCATIDLTCSRFQLPCSFRSWCAPSQRRSVFPWIAIGLTTHFGWWWGRGARITDGYAALDIPHPLHLRLTSLHSVVINACARSKCLNFFAHWRWLRQIFRQGSWRWRQIGRATDLNGSDYVCSIIEKLEEAPRTGDFLASILRVFTINATSLLDFPVRHLGRIKTWVHRADFCR